MLYEFTYKDVGRPIFRDLPRLVNTLIPFLRSEDFYLLNATMRIFCMLAYNNAEFQIKVLDHPSTMERIAFWMKSNSEDLQYSALLQHAIFAHTDDAN